MNRASPNGVTTVAVVVFAIVVVVIALGAIFLLGKPSSFTHESATLIQITFSNSDYDPDWSPDGAKIVFAHVEGETQTLYIVNADGTGLTEIGPGFDPAWSPVENKIAYTLDGQIYTMNSDGSDVTQLTTEGFNGNPAWSPDGTKIVFTRYEEEEASIWIMNRDGSEKVQLTFPENDGRCSWPSFSYDGSKIVYIKGPVTATPGEEAEPNEIWVMNNDGSNKHPIYAPGDSGQLIFQRAWNKDNKILFMKQVPGRPPDVWVINSDGSGASPVLESDQYCYGDPVWDLAGTKVALIKSSSPGSQNVFIFLWPQE